MLKYVNPPVKIKDLSLFFSLASESHSAMARMTF